MQRIQRFVPGAARVVLGLIFFVFGLNGFLGFLPQPPLPPAAGGFLGGLASAGYMFPLIKGTEVVVGLLLLSGRWVPLALTIAAPVIVNIVAFHLFLAPAGMILPIVMLSAEIALAWWYRDAFRPMLAARVEPRSSASSERPLGRAVASEA